MNDSTTKQCCRCKKNLPLDQFPKRKSGSKDGLLGWCILCEKARQSIWRENNKEQELERGRKYRAENPERSNEQSRKSRAKHRDKDLARQAAWREDHRDQERERCRIYRTEHPDKVRASSAKWAAKNPHKVQATSKVWWSKNKLKHILYSRRRDARKRSLPDNFTAQDWQVAKDYFQGCCAICCRPAGLWHSIVPDHWLPLNSSLCTGTIPTNIVPLCHGNDGCNNSKRDKLPADWLTQRFGKRKAKAILSKIEAYFEWITNDHT